MMVHLVKISRNSGTYITLLSSLLLHQATALPTITPAVEVGAVVPTATGEIGVNLVSILPPASQFQGTITPDIDRGTIKTITTGPTSQPVTTTREAFFSATTNAAGDIDISIINPALRSFLENAAEEVPACGLKRRAYCGARAFVDHFETHFDKSVQVIQDLEEAIIEGAPKHPIKIEVEKAIDLTNAEGEAEAVPDVAFSIMTEVEVSAVEAGAPAAIGALGIGFLAYAFHVYGTAKTAGTPKPAITGIHVPSNSLKAVKQTKRPTKTATYSTASSTSTQACPAETDKILTCGGYPEEQDCDMLSPVPNGEMPSCKSGQYEGCECVPPAEFKGVIVSNEERQAMIDMNNVFNSLPKEFPKLPKYGECSSKIENMDLKILKTLVDEFCTENYKLDKDAARYYTSADAYSTAFNRYMFTLDWKKSGDQKCTNQCRQIFGDGFTTSCSHNSHTMAHNGTLSLDCGTASFEIFNPETASSDLTCQDSATVIPYNVFSGFDGIIYKEFCERWTPTSLMRMVVDSKGTSKIPHPQLGKRTPPAKQEDWLEYHFDLRFKPEVGAQANKECRVGCKDAFAVFPASKCGRQGSKGNSMATYAEYDVGCGKFSYQISKPTPLTLQERHCFRADEFGEHKDINPGFLSKYIMGACVGTALKENVIRKDNPSSFIHSGTVTNGAPYQYNIYWEEGCILETGAESVSPAQPLGPTHEATCANLLRDNFKKCNNGGVGGRIQAGCLVYEFKAEKRAP